jgi:FAD binding domain/Berberine and berberine like
VAPTSASDVSKIVKNLRGSECPFTVKGGGHTPFAGGSNIQSGLTIDFEKMSSISLSPDSRTTSLGPGTRWIQAYRYLDPLKLTVIGGRVSDVGVAGLTLGGGISFLSARHGFACDNVHEFEVVLASGDIVIASPSSQHADLFWALRGGGSSNFGIVTRFSVATYSQGNLWGGSKLYPISLNRSLLHAFAEYNANNPEDRNAHLILPFGYSRTLGTWLAIAFFDYAIPTPDPPIYDAFKKLPELVSTMRVTNVSDLALELNVGEEGGKRELYRTFTVHNDVELASEILRLCFDKFSPVQGKVDLISCAFQPLPINYMTAMQKNGGNALGLDPKDGPLVIINVAVEWTNSAEDEVVSKAMTDFVDEGVKLAKQRGRWHPYIYMNYAGQDQDVQSGYGEESLKRLRKVRERYDPNGFWRRRWLGYHKLP